MNRANIICINLENSKTLTFRKKITTSYVDNTKSYIGDLGNTRDDRSNIDAELEI